MDLVADSNPFHLLFKGIPIPGGPVLDLYFIVVNGTYRIVEQRGDTHGILDSQADQRENPKLRTEQFSLLGIDPGFLPEKGVEGLYEIRIQGEEGRVERPVEGLEFIIRRQVM